MQTTAPYTPQQNGVSERLNRTLVEMARTMLKHKKLEHSFWAEAITTANYIKNRCPTKALQDLTPHEVWTGRKPNIDHLRTFGSTAYAHIPKEKRSKLDSKALQGIFLGYSEESKAYRIYDKNSGKLIVSRDVIFQEQEEDNMSPAVNLEEDQNEVTLKESEAEKPKSEVIEGPRDQEEQPKVCRSQRTHRPPGEWWKATNEECHMVQANFASLDVPSSYKEAMESPEARK